MGMRIHEAWGENAVVEFHAFAFRIGSIELEDFENLAIFGYGHATIGQHLASLGM